ncbi:MAG: BON domain-containing protein [Actinomycetota bacterium]
MAKTVVGAAIGAAGMYFFDPQLGRTRRAKLQDRAGAVLRRGAREVGRRAEYARGQAEGLRHLGSSDRPPENDQVLVAKVESEVLSRWSYPKGHINVNAVDGVVELRGTCETRQQIDDLEADVRKVTGVVDVRNFLHLPGTPAPNKQDALDT